MNAEGLQMEQDFYFKDTLYDQRLSCPLNVSTPIDNLP